MPEWDTYTLQDFLLFSPRTYGRMIEAHNAALWPAHLAALALGLALPFLRHRHWALALVWLWVGWSFLFQRYATINWVAPWFAGLFAVQALLLAVTPLRIATWRSPWAGLFALGLAYPLLGRPEAFGILPDPTALASLGLVGLASGRRRWWLAPIPLVWLAFSGLTRLALADAGR